MAKRSTIDYGKMVRVNHESGCWDWLGVISKYGYGTANCWNDRLGSNRTTLVHRHSYETHTGPIPEGMQIDHLCRNRRCCNPKHLEAVTPKENLRRARKVQPTERVPLYAIVNVNETGPCSIEKAYASLIAGWKSHLKIGVSAAIISNERGMVKAGKYPSHKTMSSRLLNCGWKVVKEEEWE